MGSRICLVEDEPLLRVMTQEDLEDLGFEVVPVTTCDEAWRMIASGDSFGCLVTDIRTPGAIDGWELARRIRTVSPQTGVIYVSGYPGTEAQPVEGSIFLSKPYLCRDLEQALEKLGV
ncbi:response regulator [Novosphingobium huizhouense]|uniref:response regulator n=1 Tax=Novosphingobium huizhouense TaxID=2866625 RepID=UPI001CD89471|nr:response regulator [Novosphingobium huizhouense]